MEDKETIKETVENSEIVTEDKKTGETDNTQLLRKRLLKIFAIILVAFVAIILIMFVISLIFKKTYTYSEVENIMKKSAIKFYGDNKSDLPKKEGDVVVIKDKSLTAAGYMKDLSEYIKDDVSCSGTVSVKLSNNQYVYSPKLDCGKAYTTVLLSEKVISVGVVESGYGLYNLNNAYVFRGENLNNYVKLDNSTWRIVKVLSDGKVMLIKNAQSYETVVWDDRYNGVDGYNTGFNNYSASRMKDYLAKYYKNDKEDETILSNSDRSKLAKYDVCVAKRGKDDTSRDGSAECSEVVKNQYMGLLPVYDYLNASVDAGCIKTVNKACQNYNYLKTDYTWWLANGSLTKDSLVYRVSSGYITSIAASTYSYIRPVIYLNSDVLYASGNGSSESPYIVR